MRRLIYGVGINDADYLVQPKVNGKKVTCPFYSKWKEMLRRCYSVKFLEKQPTYTGCTVIEGWLLFSNFKVWMMNKDWQGNELDKDLLIQGNKVYSPDNCLFVTRAINLLLNENKAARGKYPQGVDFHKASDKYKASVRIKGKQKYLGLFDTPKEAFEVYKKAKYEIIKEVAFRQCEPLKSALLAYRIDEQE